jgi:hypothetical protein
LSKNSVTRILSLIKSIGRNYTKKGRHRQL